MQLIVSKDAMEFICCLWNLGSIHRIEGKGDCVRVVEIRLLSLMDWAPSRATKRSCLAARDMVLAASVIYYVV